MEYGIITEVQKLYSIVRANAYGTKANQERNSSHYIGS
jgi:hypothetical protein